jgi:hypothetical protein
VPTLAGIGVILPVAFPIRRAINQQLLSRTHIPIPFRVVAELAFGKQFFAVIGLAISRDPVNPALL